LSVTGLIVAQDVATGACGVLNAGYFSRYWLRAVLPRRRIGAAALALLGVAAIAEALFSQALLWSRGGLFEVSDGVWALARVPLLLATVSISAIVLRRVLS